MNEQQHMPLDGDDGLRTLPEQEAFVDEALKASEEHRRHKEHQKGIDLLIEALKYGIRKDAVYYRLGNLYIDRDDLTRAEYAYGRALEVNPKHVNAMHNLSVVYRRQKKVAKYVKTYKKSQRLALRHPRNPDLSSEQKTHYRKLAGRTALWVVVAVVVVGGLLYILLR